MSNLNPADYRNGRHISALDVGETVSSDSPKVSLGSSKAVVAAIGGVVTAVSVWLTGGPFADGAIDLNEGIALVIAGLAGLGVPGIGAYLTPTKVTGTTK